MSTYYFSAEEYKRRDDVQRRLYEQVCAAHKEAVEALLPEEFTVEMCGLDATVACDGKRVRFVVRGGDSLCFVLSDAVRFVVAVIRALPHGQVAVRPHDRTLLTGDGPIQLPDPCSSEFAQRVREAAEKAQSREATLPQWSGCWLAEVWHQRAGEAPAWGVRQ